MDLQLFSLLKAKFDTKRTHVHNFAAKPGQEAVIPGARLFYVRVSSLSNL